jgi:benzoyl-CoA reductase/2-hydroxyglutaryl-CoA dehydratase subunit BcrC/BadD/HgdB
MNAKEEGKPLAWVSIMCPMEIFHAMDIVPFAVDPYAISISAFSYFKKEDCVYFDIGDSYGYPSDACSPHRACIGLAASNILPEPDVIYGSSPMPCDSAVAVFDVLSDMKKVPTHFANFEYRYHSSSAQNLKNEFEELIAFLEKHTGRKLDREKLRETVKISIKANRTMMEVHQLRKKRPCPLRARDGFNSFSMRLVGEGMPESLEFFDAQLREVRGRIERGEGVLPEERMRLVANGVYPFFAMELLDWVQDKYGAIFVADMFNCTPWTDLDENDPIDPVELLARKWLSFFGMETVYGATENTIDYVIDSVKESQVDGSIFFTHFGCKQTCGLQKIYRDKIMEELGLPTLFVDMDISDPKVVSVDQMKGKIHEYIEMIERKKAQPVEA